MTPSNLPNVPLTDTERKRLMKQKRGRQRDLARKLQISEGYLSQVISGKEIGAPHIRAGIARALRRPISQVFPPRVLDEAVEPVGGDIVQSNHETTNV